MSTTLEELEAWIRIPTETEHVEFKEAKSGFGNDKLYGYCVALSNEQGGKLVLGITDVLPRAIIGTNAFPNPGKTAKQVLDKLHFRVDIETVIHPQGRVLVIHIPSRPIGTPCHVDGQYLMRSGEALVPMTTEQLRKICEEGKPDWLDEYAIIGASAAQILELLDTKRFFDLLKVQYPSDINGVIERLEHERLICENAGTYSIKRIAAVLLGQRLDAFQGLGRKAPRVIVYDGISKTKEKLHRDGMRGYALGFAGLMRFIDEQLPQREVFIGGLHQQHKLVPDFVIRELVANALIHQDFSITGKSVMIEIYDNRVEISNPGSPIVPVPRFADENRSRNEQLSDVMRRTGICEEKGSGIDRVLETVEALQLPAPHFRADEYSTKVTIFGPKDFEVLNSSERIMACYWHCALKWVMSEKMTNQSLRKRFKIPETKSNSASQVITATIKKGLIKRDDSVGESNKFARYMPIWA